MLSVVLLEIFFIITKFVISNHLNKYFILYIKNLYLN